MDNHPKSPPLYVWFFTLLILGVMALAFVVAYLLFDDVIQFLAL